MKIVNRDLKRKVQVAEARQEKTNLPTVDRKRSASSLVPISQSVCLLVFMGGGGEVGGGVESSFVAGSCHSSSTAATVRAVWSYLVSLLDGTHAANLAF